MSGRIPSRVRITRIERNTPSKAGKAVPKNSIMNCGFGRNKVVCQYIKRRAEKRIRPPSPPPPSPFPAPGAASGGTVTYYTDGTDQPWAVHTFNASSDFTVNIASLEVDYLLVGGGGGGGAANPRTLPIQMCASGGGGGAGEVSLTNAQTLAVNVYPVVVGSGGAGGTATQYPQTTGGANDDCWSGNGGVANTGTNGVNSTFGGGTAFGGKGGVEGASPGNEYYGKGGDAGGVGGATGGNGSNINNNKGNGGGGGGAGGAGQDAGNSTNGFGGDGGDGIEYLITGVAVTYGIGGGGGCSRPGGIPAKGGNADAPGMGGSTQEQVGGLNNEAPTEGAANKGGGGGGASSIPMNWNTPAADLPAGAYPACGPNNAAAGGAGVVIVSYKVSNIP